MNKKKKNLEIILNVFPLTTLLSVTGNANKIKIAANIAITPPNLSGIERKIAQNGNKYHSGTIDAGVTKGFPGIQLSGCFLLLRIYIYIYILLNYKNGLYLKKLNFYYLFIYKNEIYYQCNLFHFLSKIIHALYKSELISDLMAFLLYKL